VCSLDKKEGEMEGRKERWKEGRRDGRKEGESGIPPSNPDRDQQQLQVEGAFGHPTTHAKLPLSTVQMEML
jgi:hypothetical protein